MEMELETGGSRTDTPPRHIHPCPSCPLQQWSESQEKHKRLCAAWEEDAELHREGGMNDRGNKGQVNCFPPR